MFDFRIKKKDTKVFLGNVLSLGILQGANYILPLITIPYLVRVLGTEYYGLIAFSMATIGYFSLLTDYGFNLSATQQVSINRDNKGKINRIFSTVMFIKIMLMILSFILLLIMHIYMIRFNNDIYIYTFLIVVGQFLFPIWLFQGYEKMKVVTYINLISKFIFTIAIFVFVKDKNDYILVPILNGIGGVISGCISLYFIFFKLNLRLQMPTSDDIKYQLKQGWYIFSSTITTSLYTISGIFILGIFTNNSIVGIYAAAEKIIQAVKGLYTPVSQSLYPLISKKISINKEDGLNFILKVSKVILPVMFILSTFIFLFAEEIVSVMLGDGYNSSIIVLKIMSFIPFIVSFSNILGIQILINCGFKKEFSKVIYIAAILGVISNILFAYTFHAIGTAVSILLVEIFVTFSMWNLVKKKVYENKNIHSTS